MIIEPQQRWIHLETLGSLSQVNMEKRKLDAARTRAEWVNVNQNEYDDYRITILKRDDASTFFSYEVDKLYETFLTILLV